MKIILLAFKQAEFLPEDLQKVRELFPDRELLVTDEPGDLESRLAEIEIAAGVVSPCLLLRNPNLRWYQQWGAGADWLLVLPERRLRTCG